MFWFIRKMFIGLLKVIGRFSESLVSNSKGPLNLYL